MSSVIGMMLFAGGAWTEGSKIVVRINARAVTIVPVKFYGVIPYRPNIEQFRFWNGDKLAARAVSLAQRAGAIATKIFFRIIPNMAIVPNKSDDSFCFNMINLDRKSSTHPNPISITVATVALKFYRAVSYRGHAPDLRSID